MGQTFLAAAYAAMCLSACAESGGAAAFLPERAAIPDRQARTAARLIPAHPKPMPVWSVTDAASRSGDVAIPLGGMDAVLAELAAGHAVVMGQGIHAPAVASGYDLDSGFLTVTMPAGDKRRLPLEGWREDWKRSERWAVAIMPPGELPSAADPRSYFQAAERLGSAASPWEAVIAYDTGMAQWPGDADALAGLAQSLYRLGDARGAAQAFAAAMDMSGDTASRQRIARMAAGVLPAAGDERPISH